MNTLLAAARHTAVYDPTLTALRALSFDGFDSGAGSRYQAKGEVKSFWRPTCRAQWAALVPNSRLLDVPADELTRRTHS